MASSELMLNEPDSAEAWLRCLAATARTKKLKDTPEERQVTDLFLSKAGVEAIKKVSTIVHPKELEDMSFEEIKRAILESVRPKKPLVIAERVKFLSLRQGKNEPVVSYLQRLRTAARFCDFEKIGQKGQSAEDDLVQMRLIDGLENSEQRTKALENFQTEEPKLSSCVNFIQQLEMISQFLPATKLLDNYPPAQSYTVMHVDKNKNQVKCKYCGLKHEQGKCPAYGKICNICNKRNHFQSVCKSKQKSVQKIEQEMSDDADVFLLNSDTNLNPNFTSVKM